MHRSIVRLKQRPDFVDGNKFKQYQDIPHHCQVKGDATYMNIAAASVLAKTYRDDRMKELAAEYPEYGWERNAGYPPKGTAMPFESLVRRRIIARVSSFYQHNSTCLAISQFVKN